MSAKPLSAIGSVCLVVEIRWASILGFRNDNISIGLAESNFMTNRMNIVVLLDEKKVVINYDACDLKIFDTMRRR